MKTHKPCFFIIGAAKAGTTSLAQQLSSHPEIFIPSKKELVFFNYHELEPANVARYEAFFNTSKKATITGEASPQYSFGATFPFCASRMSRYCPEAKIIYIVRDPVIRFQSHILQIRNWGGAGREPLGTVIKQYPQVVDASMYAARIEDYLRYFSQQQILVIQFERLVAESREVLNEICDFLGVSQLDVGGLVAKNVSAQHFEDRRVMRFLRNCGLGTVGRFLPKNHKDYLIHLVKKRQREFPELSRSDLNALQQIFREQAVVLFDNWGLDRTLWTFEPRRAVAASAGDSR